MSKKPSRLRIFAVTLIAACFLYYILGGIALWAGWLASDKYSLFAGIVGGIASVISLVSLARPSLNSEDLDTLEMQSLKRILETSEEIKKLEVARNATQQQIGSLEQQKRQMEFLVQKASLSLFLQEQHRLYEKRIQEEIGRNKELGASLAEIATIDQKIRVLNEEINADPNVDLLLRIIEAAKGPVSYQDFSEYPPVTRAVLLLGREVGKVFMKFLS